MTTGEIHGAFNAFWSKYWLRDQVCETESDEAWKSFVDQVEPSGFPHTLTFMYPLSLRPSG